MTPVQSGTAQGTQSVASNANSGADAPEETSATALASDFETFLKLLTAQLQNQDPSKPLDSTEFVAQLASFSSVEQQINTNKKLDEMISAVNSSATSNLANWLDKNVRSEAAADFTGAPIDVYYEVPEGAKMSELVVYNASDQVVSRSQLALDGTSHTWDGRDDSQVMSPNGAYSFKVESFADGKLIDNALAETFSKVVETRLEGSDVNLVFADASSMLASDVQSIRP